MKIQATDTENQSENLTMNPWSSETIHWDTVALKYLFRVVNGSTPKSSVEEYWDGNIPWATPKDIKKVGDGRIQSTHRTITDEGYESCGTTLLPKGSIILTTRAPIGKLAISETRICTNQGCKSLIPIGDVTSRYYYYVLSSVKEYLQVLGEGATFDELGTSDLKSVYLPHPQPETQRKIALFLDDRTSHTDSLIEKHQQLLKLLDEKRNAVVTDVTKTGLKQEQRMKSPDTRWLDEIPANWEVLRLDHLRDTHTPIVYGIVLPGPNQEEGVPIIKGGDCKPEKLDRGKLSKTTPEIAADYQRSRLNAGDLVYEIRGSVGRVVKIPPELEGANLTQDTARIAPKQNINEDWLMYVLESETFRQQINLHTRGATVQGVNLFDLRRRVLPVPPQKEQNQIATHLTEIDSEIQNLKELIKKEINLLEEKRQALITAAVTGQIDLSDWDSQEDQELPA